MKAWTATKATAVAHPSATTSVTGNALAIAAAGFFGWSAEQLSMAVGAVTALGAFFSYCTTHGGIKGLLGRIWGGE